MRTADISLMIVIYNLVIGILIILASEKIASIGRGLGARTVRYVKVTTLTFGSGVAAVSAFVLVAFHLLRLGVD